MRTYFDGTLRALSVVLWLTTIFGGFTWMSDYESRPGKATAMEHADDGGDEGGAGHAKFRLVMAVHPHCPCTHAALEQLGELLVAHPNRIRAEIILVKPAGVAPGWERGFIASAASRLPAVQIQCDEAGAEVRRHGVQTSSHVLLYSNIGTLVFSGGITRSRGHAGQSLGTRSIAAIVMGETPETVAAEVFGCPLF